MNNLALKNIYFNLKAVFIFFILFIFLICFIFFGSLVGDVKIQLSSLFPNFIENFRNNTIIFEYRLPRLLVGACVGANFAISGAILQAITKNALAAPNIIGINSGASFFSVLSLLVLAKSSFFILPIAAFTGALLAGAFVYFLATRGGVSPIRLILSGVAIDAFFQAATTFVLVNNSLEVGSALIWLSGSLWGKSWHEFYFIFPCSVIGIVLAYIFSQRINILHFSEEIIVGVGLNIKLNRIILLILAIFLSASAVCLVGPIGFVGLIIPHMVRALVGHNYKLIIPFSAILGSFLVLLSDILGRVFFSPNEIPAGIIASFIGSPYFIYLLAKSKF